MSKLRSVSTSVWSDVWFEDLNPNQKLIWLYLITNEKTNMLGIYEVSLKKISFETGVNKSEIEKALNEFKKTGRVKYEHNHIILVKFLKHQNFNTNMKKSAIDVYMKLPKELVNSDLKIDKTNPLEGFERLSKHLGMVRKVEVEYEVELEYELEVEKEIDHLEKIENLFNKFWNQYDKKTNREKCFKKFQLLKENELNLLFEHVPKYVESTPEKKYRKNPETYLNNKSFNDEIIAEETSVTKNYQAKNNTTAFNGNNTKFEPLV